MAASVQDMTRFLVEVLSVRLTAFLAGLQAGKPVRDWASGAVREIDDSDVEQRLRTAYEIVLLLLIHDSAGTVRSWFIGMNPELDDVSPAETIREGNLQDARVAAHVFFVCG
jgi:hypothetical protein